MGRKNNSAKAEQGSTPQPTAIGKARSTHKRVSTTRGVKKGTQGPNLLGKDKGRTRAKAIEYTDAIGEEIVERTANGEALKHICEDEHLPAEQTVRKWIRTENHALSSMYVRAREAGLLKAADELIDLADTATTENYNALRLRLDTRKWVLSKLIPKTFGDRLDTRVEAEVKVTQSMPSDGELARILAAAIAEAEAPILLEAHSVTDTGAGP